MKIEEFWYDLCSYYRLGCKYD